MSLEASYGVVITNIVAWQNPKHLALVELFHGTNLAVFKAHLDLWHGLSANEVLSGHEDTESLLNRRGLL